jgi:hypothetical protein
MQTNGEPWRWDIWSLSGSDRYQGGTLAGVTSRLEPPALPPHRGDHGRSRRFPRAAFWPAIPATSLGFRRAVRARAGRRAVWVVTDPERRGGALRRQPKRARGSGCGCAGRCATQPAGFDAHRNPELGPDRRGSFARSSRRESGASTLEPHPAPRTSKSGTSVRARSWYWSTGPDPGTSDQ